MSKVQATLFNLFFVHWKYIIFFYDARLNIELSVWRPRTLFTLGLEAANQTSVEFWSEMKRYSLEASIRSVRNRRKNSRRTFNIIIIVMNHKTAF